MPCPVYELSKRKKKILGMLKRNPTDHCEEISELMVDVQRMFDAQMRGEFVIHDVLQLG